MNLPPDTDIVPDPAGLGRGWTIIRGGQDDKGPYEEWVGRFWDHYPSDAEATEALKAQGWL